VTDERGYLSFEIKNVWKAYKKNEIKKREKCLRARITVVQSYIIMKIRKGKCLYINGVVHTRVEHIRTQLNLSPVYIYTYTNLYFTVL